MTTSSGTTNANCREHGGAAYHDMATVVAHEPWYQQDRLVIVVIGASGDLAKKKTYPALLELWSSRLLPTTTINPPLIWGYARTKKTHEELRQHLEPTLRKQQQQLSSNNGDDDGDDVVTDFLSHCFYHSGSSYGDVHAFQEMMELIQLQQQQNGSSFPPRVTNILFYLAIPPDVFGETATTIRQVLNGMAAAAATTTTPSPPSTMNIGWTRLVVEKPFGRDLMSCQELLQTLSLHFAEDQLYRIDHYLGKEVVQNLPVLRMSNPWMEPLFFHHSTVQSVLIRFQEPFGTEGRGGYFDPYGIIRDIMQNHLLQVLTLVAMELSGQNHPTVNSNNCCDNDDKNDIRNAKVQVLQSMPPIVLEDVLLGQYEGYTDDPTIANPDTRCPTYAAVRCWINNERWQGVPFILEAGKALDQRVCEVRIQLKQPLPQATTTRNKTASTSIPSNELVLRIQPDPAIYLTTQIKTPGFGDDSTRSTSMAINYQSSMDPDAAKAANVDAYTRLMLDVLRGRSQNFVRDDELVASWKIFTPLLHQIDYDDTIRPVSYEYGSSGPAEREEFMQRMMMTTRQATTTGDRNNEEMLAYHTNGVRHSAL